jgi:hypothetical protein
MVAKTFNVKRPKCKLSNICKILYEVETLGVNCSALGNTNRCKLASDISSGSINEFVLSLLEKKIRKKKRKGKYQLRRAVCPRSLSTRVELQEPCMLYQCPYNSKKLSYNCVLLHNNIFFEDYEDIPQKVMEVSLGVTNEEFKKLLKYSVYMSRLYVIMLKYNKEYLKQRRKLVFESGNLSKLLKPRKNILLCHVCSSVVNNTYECSCMTDRDLRRSRINFSTNWVEAILNSYNEIMQSVNINKFSPDEAITLFNRYKRLKVIRSMIGWADLEGLKFYHIPFGYVINAFSQLFDENDRNKAENLGLTDKLYNKALELFHVSDT